MRAPKSFSDTSSTSYGTQRDPFQLTSHNPNEPSLRGDPSTPPLTRIFNYSNHLGILTTDDSGLREGNAPWARSRVNSYLTRAFSEAGGFNNNIPERQKVQGYTVETSWKHDPLGRTSYVGHGKIIEVDDADGTVQNSPQHSAHEFPHLDTGLNIPHIITSPLPPGTTPPPRPGQGYMHLLPTPTGDRLWNADFALARSAFHASGCNPSGMDEYPDFTLLSDCLALIKMSLESIQYMHKTFISLAPTSDVESLLDMCGHLRNALNSVQEALSRRSQIDEEQWRLRSPSWQGKYRTRLISLSKSLQRLRGIERFLSYRKPRVKQLELILRKLQEHEAKLLDLRAKFNSCFDRLKVRYLHALLIEAHTEARQKQETRLASRDSFQRRWFEGKVDRANLRHEFHMYHAGRYPAAM